MGSPPYHVLEVTHAVSHKDRVCAQVRGRPGGSGRAAPRWLARPRVQNLEPGGSRTCRRENTQSIQLCAPCSLLGRRGGGQALNLSELVSSSVK